LVTIIATSSVDSEFVVGCRQKHYHRRLQRKQGASLEFFVA